MSERCFVNQIFGGGVFVCRRPPKPGGNGFCEFHGNKRINEPLDLELTWKEWLKVWFIRKPRNILRRIRQVPRDIRFWWRTRKNPPCFFCSNRSMLSEHGRRVCFDHYGP